MEVGVSVGEVERHLAALDRQPRKPPLKDLVVEKGQPPSLERVNELRRRLDVNAKERDRLLAELREAVRMAEEIAGAAKSTLADQGEAP
jgi:hypothetical protein